MTDYVTLRNRIIDELANDGALTTAQVNYAIQDTIKFHERRPWYFNQTVGTFSTVAAQEYYSSADLAAIPNIINIASMLVTNSGIKTPVVGVTFETLDDVQDGSMTGIPGNFTIWQQQIRLYPIPDGVYTVTMAYIYRLTALSADEDSNAWTTDAEELIRQGAKRRIAMNYFHADDVAARVAPMEQEALAALMAEDRRRRPNTVLRPPAMLPQSRFNIYVG
jgi:hypothetical protein